MIVTVVHPAFGTVTLFDAYIQNGYVIGDAGEEIYVMGCTYSVPCTMNFPLSCVKDLDGQAWPFRKGHE